MGRFDQLFDVEVQGDRLGERVVGIEHGGAADDDNDVYRDVF